LRKSDEIFCKLRKNPLYKVIYYFTLFSLNHHVWYIVIEGCKSSAYEELKKILVFVGQEHNFAKYSRGEADDINSIYDENSIMHYGKFAFSKNGKPTIQSIGDKNRELGQRRSVSKEDIIQLNALYRCAGKDL